MNKTTNYGSIAKNRKSDPDGNIFKNIKKPSVLAKGKIDLRSSHKDSSLSSSNVLNSERSGGGHYLNSKLNQNKI